MDTLKFFLSLYGHKLPALTLDISSDSSLIVTGSADKNVKIWGLDFGDCHKSIFAHDDSVTGVQFIPNTHYFFTVGKDGLLKQWDADNYERIITLKGHINEVSIFFPLIFQSAGMSFSSKNLAIYLFVICSFNQFNAK